MARAEQEPTEIPGKVSRIEWPNGNFDNKTLGSIVVDSKSQRLRRRIASQIVIEGLKLSTQLEQNSQFLSEEEINRRNSSIEGFNAVAKSIIQADIHDMNKAGIFLEPRSLIAEELRLQRKEAIKSLKKDPTGAKFIQREYKKEELIYNNTNDPRLIGFRIGMDRYKEWYSKAVKAGAQSDKKNTAQKAGVVLKIVQKRIKVFR